MSSGKRFPGFIRNPTKIWEKLPQGDKDVRSEIVAELQDLEHCSCRRYTYWCAWWNDTISHFHI